MEIGQQKEERKNQLEIQNRTMMQKTAEFDKSQADLNSKEQRQFQLQSQRDSCINHIEQIRTRTDVNEQKFKENQHTIAETIQARREQQITKQVIIHDILPRSLSSLYFAALPRAGCCQ